MTTLREHLEAIRDRGGAPYLDTCECWVCDNRRHAVAALALLDAAPIDIFTSTFVRVPSSEFVDAVRLAPETRHRTIFDPEPSA